MLLEHFRFPPHRSGLRRLHYPRTIKRHLRANDRVLLDSEDHRMTLERSAPYAVVLQEFPTSMRDFVESVTIVLVTVVEAYPDCDLMKDMPI